MASGPRNRQSIIERYAPVVFAAIVVGALIAPVAWHVTRPDTEGTVAVIELSTTITGSSAQSVIEHLREARQNESIEAVVLRIDSPGGGAAASEQLYLAVRKTAKEMPVVSAVTGLGASGAYYAMVPSDTIYVTPSSLVGSVGVRATLPPAFNNPNQVTTGPDKSGGRTAEETRAQVETLRRAFIDTVFKHRGNEIKLSREQVAYAKVYTGARAVENGMADKIGGVGSAIQEAAKRAGLDSYDVTRKEVSVSGIIILSASAGNETVVVQGEPFDYEQVDSPQFLMLYGQIEHEEVITNDEK